MKRLLIAISFFFSMIPVAQSCDIVEINTASRMAEYTKSQFEIGNSSIINFLEASAHLSEMVACSSGYSKDSCEKALSQRNELVNKSQLIAANGNLSFSTAIKAHQDLVRLKGLCNQSKIKLY